MTTKMGIDPISIVSDHGQLLTCNDSITQGDYTYFTHTFNGEIQYTAILEISTGRYYFQADDNLAKLYGYQTIQEVMLDDRILDFFNEKEKELGYSILKFINEQDKEENVNGKIRGTDRW